MDYAGYIIAWLRYVAKAIEILLHAVTVVRDGFTGVKIPKKDEYSRTA
jgi:hypothetical protein